MDQTRDLTCHDTSVHDISFHHCLAQGTEGQKLKFLKRSSLFFFFQIFSGHLVAQYTDRMSGGSSGDSSGGGETSGGDEVVIYYNVNFVSDGKTVSQQKIERGKYAELPEEPKRDGAEFLHWSLDENGDAVDVKSYTVTENGIYDRAKLSEFEYTPLAEFDTDFLKESGCNQIGDCYKRAQSLALWLSYGISDFPTPNGTGASTESASIDVSESGGELYRYYFTGISYDSFYKALLDVFTQEKADELISDAASRIYSYDGALWIGAVSGGGDTSVVKTEYQVTDKTDDRIVLKRTTWHVNIGEEPIYDSAKDDEYEKEYADYSFVKTEQGWRADSMPLR